MFISPEQRAKMIEGIKRSWKNADARKERNRQMIKRHCLPKAHTPSINEKRVKSRQSGKGWKHHTNDTKKRMSETFKSKWKRGDYDGRSSIQKSEGQKELHAALLKLGYVVVPEYRVDNKPFDCAVLSEKLLFEFNGTYWHLDPREFEAHYWDSFRGMSAEEIWRKDMKKVLDAKNKEYRTITIWQQDWESASNKEAYLLTKINERSE